ncbi:MAG: D-aminoacyl-tRNA deacylase [Candidatus Komeilibacteria bacterium]|nr:D-aminoacyl-tRNA deacylase [Candidatus Komeilibacteria bacterium]
MRAVVQKVSEARVKVANQVIGEINFGLLVLLGITHDDTETTAVRMADKLVKLRLFADRDGKMNRSIRDGNGSIMIVSQFTLYADTSAGARPSFMAAAEPDHAKPLYEKVIEEVRNRGISVDTGKFGAIMEVELTNDGPVTLIIDV